MCIPGLFGGNNGQDEAAAAARAEEAARQGRIAAGQKKIGEVFGQYDDSFYGNVSKAALDYYNPEVQRQYEQATKGLTYALARSGNLKSTSGATKLRELAEAKGRADVDISGRARDYANSVRSNVERSRSDLTSQLYASADPEGIYNSALTQSAAASATPSFDPLGNLFASYTALGANGLSAERAGYRGLGTGLFPTSSSSRGSSKVVA